jgi:hypothetical protein
LFGLQLAFVKKPIDRHGLTRDNQPTRFPGWLEVFLRRNISNRRLLALAKLK